jgi:phosphoserine aminotransferase
MLRCDTNIPSLRGAFFARVWMMQRPLARPDNPCFSSGPTAKRPGWSLAALEAALTGRSHRSREGKGRLQEVVDRSRSLLGIPPDYRIAIMAGSDTGAFEGAAWSLLGARGVDVLVFESFGEGWLDDIDKQLKLENCRLHQAPYGELPDLDAIDGSRDIVFCWNGTTSGVRVPDGDWIPDDRVGLTLCDATSAAFAMELPWRKLDVVTWSWQKVLGGEAQHGMLVLSPRAVERLEAYKPPWPLPKIFRLTKGGKLNEGIFKAETINTPSMLAVEDALDGLRWAESIGGLPALIERCRRNLAVVEGWVERTDWVGFLAARPEIRSPTSVCLTIEDPAFRALDATRQAAFIKDLTSLLAEERVAYDIASYRDAPAGLRLWCGATVETRDVEALVSWLDWAHASLKSRLA